MAQPTSMPESILKMRELLASDPTEGRSATGGWDQAWKADLTPWDSKNKDVQPALRELVEERWAEVGLPLASLSDGMALVPGCGRGYDAVFFASKGIDAIGLDLSATAVEAAKAHHAAQPGAPSNVELQAVVPLPNVPTEARLLTLNWRGLRTSQAADFFDFALPGGRPFSLAYDFTFFCAIPPGLRGDWGKRYADVIRKGGLLITLAFPLGVLVSSWHHGDRKGGPPYSVSEAAYGEALSSNFE
ncbi:SPOSA6832_03669, partial [Sporobolomyces salmonicolor]